MDWWEKCKPVERTIVDISKSKRFIAAAVEEIFQQNRSHPECNDGFYAEGFTEVVAKALANDFLNVVNLAASKKGLSDFLVKNIDASADWHDLDRITTQAKAKFPVKAKNLCRVLATTTEKASKKAKSAAKQ